MTVSFSPDHASELYADEVSVEINSGVGIRIDLRVYCCYLICIWLLCEVYCFWSIVSVQSAKKQGFHCAVNVTNELPNISSQCSSFQAEIGIIITITIFSNLFGALTALFFTYYCVGLKSTSGIG